MQLGGFDVKYDPKKPPTLDDFGHSGVNRSIGSQMAAEASCQYGCGGSSS